MIAVDIQAACPCPLGCAATHATKAKKATSSTPRRMETPITTK